MKKALVLVLLVLVVGSLSFFIFGSKNKDIPLSSGSISLCKTQVSYGLADSDNERKRGLSGRSGISEGEGLLFVFKEPTIPSFWMKDMNFPIDIVWIDENKKIVDITEDFSIDSYPQTKSPVSKISYALEVRSGFAKDHHCIIGSAVEF